MKSAVLTIALGLLTLCASAQSLSGLIEQLERADSDSARIQGYREIAQHYQFSNMDSALLYAREGLAYARAVANPRGEALMAYTIAHILERHGILEQAEEHYKFTCDLYESLGDVQALAAATNGLGVVAGRTSRYDEATRHFLKALSLYESIDNRRGIVQTYIKLGVVNDYLQNLDQALEYYLKAEGLNADAPSSNATLTLLNNIGIVYGKRNDLRTALQYFQRGLRQSDPHKHTGIHITLLGSLGLVYEKLGVPDSAWFYQQQALSMARQNNLPEEEARSLVNLAALVRRNDPGQGIALLDQALQLAQDIQHLVLITEVYEAMIGIYKDQQQYQRAMELAEKRQVIKDSLFSIEKSRVIANLQATHEIARQENEIRELALKNERSMVQRNILFGVAIISVIMIIIVWFYNTRVSSLNRQLMRKQEELKDSNTIKDKLFSVLGHDLRAPLNRVIGMLNLLSMSHHDQDELDIIEKLKQQSQGTLDTLDNLLMWGQNQLKGIKLDQQTLLAKDQVRKSIVLTDPYATQKRVQLVDDVPADVYVRADPAHFDFIMRNLLSNAIKFSHAGGTVAINATPSQKEVVFSVADSGIGIPKSRQHDIFMPGTESLAGTWNEKGTGIGLMLCHEYVAENGGRLWVDSKEGVGSTFYFSLPRETSSKEARERVPEMA